ncbi:uncharacterized protein PHACADRAFT_255075 [Phanerochaete carnosa HHB-10118-sp]|uniref:Uncharacterized protein n=1 Tax=Phanerochaete carnosa (strain HHB-10118-sp) TaxID=650164 RepID=K5WDM8_PHACS|nr:uncharacterized protein PHACADRAFT_255075 [Phanerochaete carnosa HHB-10118-sp]EKM57360.1 hypothetical protein PHACADRAFT_255075 [Phanerochaete carnosa HHB-10118-sp]
MRALSNTVLALVSLDCGHVLAAAKGDTGKERTEDTWTSWRNGKDISHPAFSGGYHH